MRTAKTMDLRAMTFNIRYDTVQDGPNAWPYRRELVYQVVRDASPHIVGFQEVLPRQREDLENNLEGYLWVGHGRDADHGGEQCCLAISPGLHIEDSGTFWLCPTPEIAGAVGWDAHITRICSWVRLKQGEAQFTVYNAHWDHRGEIARLESSRLLLEKVLATPGPVILMGDFNTVPDSPPIHRLTSILQDSYGELNPDSPTPTFHNFGRDPVGSRIDYLMASPEFLTVECRILDQPRDPYPSDHFPVFARYELFP